MSYGTPKQNSKEMIQWDNNGCNQKLTMECVKEIRYLYNNEIMNTVELAKKY